MQRLLEISDLHIAFDTAEDTVRGVSLDINTGEIVGIAGPSGSGKSLTMWAIPGLIPANCRMSGSFKVYNANGSSRHIHNAEELKLLAGRFVTIIPQNPFTSLNPVFRCGIQVEEMIRTESSHERKARVLLQLKRLGFDDPDRIYTAYPFELSGGQLQRVVIAMATIGDPELIIADEPTTALDIVTQLEVLELLAKWVSEHQKSMFLVSHHITLLQKYCDRIYAMRNGEIIRSGAALEVGEWLQLPEQSREETPEEDDRLRDVLCSVRNLNVRYTGRSGDLVHAVRDVSFRVHYSEIIGIVGATGCGKSTIGKVLTGLVQPLSGQVEFMDKSLDFERYPQLRKQIQMIFQDPYSALYPHMTIGGYLREAIRHHRICQRKEETDLIASTLERVGLPAMFGSRYPHQLSGGERQRVQIARAVLLQPMFLICDEITSGLDAAIQAQILQVLLHLHASTGMSLLIISHDLSVIRYMARRVIVVDAGAIVEEGDANRVFSQPRHVVTQTLITAQMH